MRRILLLLTVALVLVAMIAVMAAPAFAHGLFPFEHHGCEFLSQAFIKSHGACFHPG